jgi:hypothetical protein
MTTRKLPLFALLATLLFGSIACGEDKKEPEPTPAPVNQLTFNGNSRTLSHAYAISFEENLIVDNELYRYFELVLSTRDIAVFYLEN